MLPCRNAQKKVTVNDALAHIGALLNTSVINRDLATPPESPSDGALYIVAANASNDWLEKENRIACFGHL